MEEKRLLTAKEAAAYLRISLFTLHVLWPFLWIWATLYREDRGRGFHSPHPTTAAPLAELKAELAAVSARVEAQEKPAGD